MSPSRPDGYVTEREWMAVIVQAARLLGWHVYHTWRSDRSPAGFPDLTLVRVGRDGIARLVFWEVKTVRGRVTDAQQAWLELLGRVPGVQASVVRPADWEYVSRVLREGA